MDRRAANQAKVKLDVNGSVSGQSTLDESIPYPTLAANVTIKPFSGFHIKAEIEGASAGASGTDVDILDARVQAEFYVAHVLGFFAGYRQYRFDVGDDDFGSIHNSFKGPYAGIGLKF